MPKPSDAGWVFRATVVKIVDADTLDASVDLGFYITRVDRFRLLGSDVGINAPELNAKDPDIRAKAQAAKARVAELCPVGSPVILFTEKAPSQDGFGRWLASVFTMDGLNVGDVLLDEGLATEYRRA